MIDFAGRIRINEFTLSDVELLMSYWYDSPEHEIRRTGVLRERMQSREDFTKKMIEKVQNASELKSNYVAISFNDRTIGVHSIGNIKEGVSAAFHAHIFDKSLRGKGIGKTSYLKACEIFYNRFSLEKIEFNTPSFNEAPNKLKLALGIPFQGKIIVENLAPLMPNLELNQYLLAKEKFKEIYKAYFLQEPFA